VQLAQRAGIQFSAIETGQIRGRSPWTMARNLGRMRRGAAQAATVIQDWKPDVVLMTGGYVAAPVAWAAWRSRPRVPLLIYLPDLTPGQAIKVTSRLATKVAVSFPEAARYFPGKAVVTGYPVRPELLAADKTAARALLRLQPDAPVLLVFGGSRGARSINRALVAALPQLLPRCQVVHVSGQLDWPEVEQARQGLADTLPPALFERYHPYPYLHDEMVQALAAADLAVTRAGASVLGEFPARGLPSILVPYPYAGQHQDANAAYLADRDAAVVIVDTDLSARLAPTILELLDAPGELQGISQAAARLARPDAAHNIAALLYKMAGR
jgi:UDP-N-acetylglucosamine--N-acetylmuramyl-(pentapeptide) pyrophosphoryl-undecaprenol N-acetylglucosamine transferase